MILTTSNFVAPRLIRSGRPLFGKQKIFADSLTSVTTTTLRTRQLGSDSRYNIHSAEFSLRVAVITLILIVVFIFFPAALVFIFVFFLIWLFSQKNIDSYQEVRKA